MRQLLPPHPSVTRHVCSEPTARILRGARRCEKNERQEGRARQPRVHARDSAECRVRVCMCVCLYLCGEGETRRMGSSRGWWSVGCTSTLEEDCHELRVAPEGGAVEGRLTVGAQRIGAARRQGLDQRA